jgi:hypothetical protein
MPKRSFVWNHFYKDADKPFAICYDCGNRYKTSGNTSNLIDHLVRAHQFTQKESTESSGNASESSENTYKNKKDLDK